MLIVQVNDYAKLQIIKETDFGEGNHERSVCYELKNFLGKPQEERKIPKLFQSKADDKV